MKRTALVLNVLYIGEILEFRKNTSPPSSGSKSKSRKKAIEVGCKLSLWYNPELHTPHSTEVSVT
jgi:hypothetical protein